jgi:hypothetical protein
VASTIPPQPDTVGFRSGCRISGYWFAAHLGVTTADKPAVESGGTDVAGVGA